ncbi:cytochrome c [uncultured Jannaschia sp.]|uniref:c-type cytochrome n=1 Tax=uncultured Jannaschia sp. TaxID=293347 RepID=UPI002614B26C|nr:cytochrome c [uncultured Jannaschia sp.]
MGRMITGIGLGVVGTLLVGVVVWLTVTYSGAYNVAATDPHADAVRWTLDTTMHRSVARRAGEVERPDSFSEELIAEGAGHYAGSCVHCHGAPGRDPSAWSRGMRPEPPHLVEAAAEWRPGEIHWIVENGIKMSGMPAFGEHHTLEEIAGLTAFVTRLPGMSPEDYAALTGDGAHGAEGHAHATEAEASEPAETGPAASGGGLDTEPAEPATTE